MEKQEEEVLVVNVFDMLNETIFNENEHVEELAVGTNERKQAIDALEKFYKLRIEESKVLNEQYNSDQKFEMEKEFQQKRLELEQKMHEDKMKLEYERFEMEKLNHENEMELKKAQTKAENKRLWIELGKAGAALLAWFAVTNKVMKFEETGTIRSKAFPGTLPKLKFW